MDTCLSPTTHVSPKRGTEQIPNPDTELLSGDMVQAHSAEVAAVLATLEPSYLQSVWACLM